MSNRNAQRTPPAASRSRDRLIMAVAIPLGALLLLIGQLGSRTGIVSLPFDQHHVLTQILGFGLLLFGLSRWR